MDDPQVGFENTLNVIILCATFISTTLSHLYLAKFRLGKLEEEIKNLEKKYVSKEAFNLTSQHTKESLEEIKSLIKKTFRR